MDNKTLAEAFKNTLIDLLQNDDNIQNIICNIVSKQKNYENLIDNYKKQIGELESKIDKLKSENSQIIDGLNEKIDGLNNKIQELQSTNQQLNSNLEYLQNSNAEKDIMFAEANDEIVNLKYELKKSNNIKKDCDKLKK